GTLFTPGFFLSLSGGLLAVLVMILLFRLRIFSLLTVSIAGALAHNAGQLWVAATLLFRNPVLWYLLPYLLLTGVLTGVVTGVFSFWLLKRLEGDFEQEEKE
ncbi:MAG: Gx transporter family protein, partial [Calditrichaeota bacterium]|nr:Gx transporter family protein [Calditrichota bacterium]